MILDSTGTLKPSATLSYADTIIGLPTLIICLQVVPFAFLFYYAYSIKPYTKDYEECTTDPQNILVDDNGAGIPSGKRYQGGRFGVHAWLALFNPGELIRNIKATFKMFRDSKIQQPETGMGQDFQV